MLNRQVPAGLLQPEYTALPARNAEPALERGAYHVPDLVVLAVMMPAWTATKCCPACAPIGAPSRWR